MGRMIAPPPQGSTALRRSLAAGVLALWAAPASACLVCVELPEDTLTDRIWAAEAIALVRPDPDNAFAYAPVKLLAGASGDPVPFLVDSASRRRFAADPALVALVLRAPGGEWELAGQGGPEIGRFVSEAMAQETAWSDEADDPDRAAAFRALHAQDHALLRKLALNEMARMPYAQVRQTEVALAVDWLSDRLVDPGWYGWQPVLVKLLGLHPDPAARDILRARALTIRPEDRAPWLVALIEADGEAGIARMLGDSQDGAAARAAIRALVTHAGATPEHAPAVAAALVRLASDHPGLAAEAVPGLAALGDFSLAPRVADLLASGAVADPAEAFALKLYLAQARAGQAAPRAAAAAAASRFFGPPD